MSLISLLATQPLIFFALILAFIVSLSVHEASHALAGSLLGDSTARRQGRLTLDPRAHIDPWGFVSLLFIGFGWGKPVPYNPYSLKYPRWGPALVALAGPVSNLVLGLFFAFLAKFTFPLLGSSNLLVVFALYAAILNFSLMLFNLIPVTPLDGSAPLLALFDLLKWRKAAAWLAQHGPTALMVLVVADMVLRIGIFSWISTSALWIVSLITG